MSLLPRTAEEFSSAEYWERFFKKRGDKAFEWYGDYNTLCGVLHKYIKVKDQVNMTSMCRDVQVQDVYRYTLYTGTGCVQVHTIYRYRMCTGT